MRPTLSQTDCDLFLHTVREIAGDVGVTSVYAARMGAEIIVPRRVSVDHWLSLAIGHEPALKVCRALMMFDANNRPVEFRCYLAADGQNPVAKLEAELNVRAETLLKQGGLRAVDIARAVGLSERTVRRIRVRLRKGASQGVPSRGNAR